MSSIRTTTEIMTNPLKLQQLELQKLQIKEQKNRWKYIAIAFFLGLITSLGTVLLINNLESRKKEPNVTILLQTVNRQAKTIQSLLLENNKLKRTLKKVENPTKQE